MKLELKHLSPYLPYKVQIYGSSELWELFGIDRISEDEIFVNLMQDFDSNHPIFYREASMFEHSLILRPLSDLTKEIEVNGEKFVPIEKIQLEYGIKLEYDVDCVVWYPTYRGRSENLFMSIYPIQELLFKWHFDCFQLIENDLAIDINTLTK